MNCAIQSQSRLQEIVKGLYEMYEEGFRKKDMNLSGKRFEEINPLQNLFPRFADPDVKKPI